MGGYYSGVWRAYGIEEKDLMEAMRAAAAILKRGNDVELRRKGDGYVVSEVKKEIKYRTPV